MSRWPLMAITTCLVLLPSCFLSRIGEVGEGVALSFPVSVIVSSDLEEADRAMNEADQDRLLLRLIRFEQATAEIQDRPQLQEMWDRHGLDEAADLEAAWNEYRAMADVEYPATTEANVERAWAAGVRVAVIDFIKRRGITSCNDATATPRHRN